MLGFLLEQIKWWWWWGWWWWKVGCLTSIHGLGLHTSDEHWTMMQGKRLEPKALLLVRIWGPGFPKICGGPDRPTSPSAPEFAPVSYRVQIARHAAFVQTVW